MKISYRWLREYIDLCLTPDELKEKMTFAGIEVEAVETIGENLRGILVANILEKTKHPDADKLSVCRIDTGSEILQVVCGAPNCAAGQKIAFAPVGATLGDITLKKAKLRGVESFGMICSERELGLSDNHDGIMVLPEDAPIGTSLSDYLNLSDTVYDVEITPNRPDLLGMIGVARDLSALLGIPLKLPKISLRESSEHAVGDILALRNDAPDLCTRYIARIIRGVKVMESPEWLKRHLMAVGMRPINNVVDVTNFVMMEYGHPLHAFDYHLVKGGAIIVRRAADNEPFIALDNRQHTLCQDDLVIADESRAIGIAGVIGGQNSQITEETCDIIIEAANFLYSSIRRTSDRYKIETDAAYRFERDLSDKNAQFASERAVQLILETAGGNLYRGTLDSWPKHPKRTVIALHPQKVREFLAADIPDGKMVEYLTALGLKRFRESDGIPEFTVPYYRKDLTREIDLVEEIIRLHGYNQVASFLKPQRIMNRPFFYLRRAAQDALTAEGFFETLNWPFGDPENLDKLQLPENDRRRLTIPLVNPVGVRFSVMQTTLLPNLFKNAVHNQNRGEVSPRLFELAKTYFPGEGKLALEQTHVAGIMLGTETAHWSRTSVKLDFYDIKGVVEAVIEAVSLEPTEYVISDEPFLMRGQAADILMRGGKIGFVGRMDARVAERFGIEEPAYVFELDLDAVMRLRREQIRGFSELPKYPPVLRDISFVIDRGHSLDELMKEMYKSASGLREIVLFDEYQGKGIPTGSRSLSFHLAFYSPIKTLTGDTVTQLVQKLVENLKTKFQIEMR